MPDLVWQGATVLILSASLLWIGAVVLRMINRALAEKTGSRRRALGAALVLWSEAKDDAKLDAAFADTQPHLLLDAVSRILPFAGHARREMMEAALARNGFDGHVERHFDNADAGQRLLCCEILGSIGGRRSVNILLRALTDPAPSVRVGAAISLAQLGHLPPLTSTLERLGRKALRSSRLIHVFEELLATRPQEVRALALNRSCEPQLRIAALRALVRLWDSEALSTMQTLANDRSMTVAKGVARLAGDMGAAEGGPIVIRLLGSDCPYVRRAGAETAGRLADRRLVGALRGLADDPDHLTRHAAKKALGQIDQAGRTAEFSMSRSKPAQRQVA